MILKKNLIDTVYATVEEREYTYKNIQKMYTNMLSFFIVYETTKYDDKANLSYKFEIYQVIM